METTIRVFLADDHAMVREGLAALVADEAGIDVVGQAGNGLEAIRAIGEVRPDVVVLDVRMPGLNGLDVCREIRRANNAPHVLILTMYDDEQIARRAFRYGAAGYLLKDGAADQLAEAIRRVAAGEKFVAGPMDHSLLEDQDAQNPYETLSTRERQVLQLIAEGKTNRAIAEILGLSAKTVDTHRTRLMRKLDIHDQTSLVKFAIRQGVIRFHPE